jgi:hypothetical protein
VTTHFNIVDELVLRALILPLALGGLVAVARGQCRKLFVFAALIGAFWTLIEHAAAAPLQVPA